MSTQTAAASSGHGGWHLRGRADLDGVPALARRGLRGVKLVVSDAHEGINAAVSKVLNATRQRCRVHFMRNVLAHPGKSGRRVVSAFIATAFAQDTPKAASAQWRAVADQIRPKVPKLAAIMDEAEHDVLAYMSFPKQHWAKLHSTNPIERLNCEIKPRTEVVGLFPNDDAIVRLVGGLLLERIEHVQLAMPSGEEDAARRFYAGALGMTEVRKPLNLAKRGGCWFEAGRVRVHLGVEADFRPAKKAHPAFVVDELESFRASERGGICMQRR